MSSRTLSITEPHPSLPKTGSTYITSGRGGAGNYRRYKAEDLTDGASATGPASRIALLPKSLKKSYLPIGRGGNGNMYKPATDEERVFQFDEEMARRGVAQAPVYHIGRGGAANWVDEREEASASSQRDRMRQDSSSSESVNSERSSGSGVRRTFSSLTRKISS